MHRLRLMLLPFSWIYGLILFFRNKAYDWHFLKSFNIPKKSICIGNLSTGGTGKTPHTLYLAKYLAKDYDVSILSRGYGRITSGFYEVSMKSTASEVGDEPLLMKKALASSAAVYVCENRKVGIERIQVLGRSDIFLLDDAFQHRAVKCGLNILLTSWDQPFFRDFVLPAGNLREWRSGKNRAQLLVVTKTPEDKSEEDFEIYRGRLQFPAEKVFFSSISYGQLKSFGKPIDNISSVLLVTGIANPTPLVEYLNRFYRVEAIQFKDHHDFKDVEIQKIHDKFDNFADSGWAIVTTEKDYVRLISSPLKESLSHYPWYFQEMDIKIKDEEKFLTLINQYARAI